MDNFFSQCSSLIELNISNFNTKKVTNMSIMFYKCSSLKNLNILNFNRDKVSDMIDIFKGCPKKLIKQIY